MILLLEDNDAVAEVVAMHLESAGHGVARAATAGEAMALARDSEPRAVLLDQRLMGGASGLEWLAAARAEGVRCPAVGLTAEPPPAAGALEALGVVDWLTKPVRRQRLLEALDRALG